MIVAKNTGAIGLWPRGGRGEAQEGDWDVHNCDWDLHCCMAETI